jgi:hypothetical protein
MSLALIRFAFLCTLLSVSNPALAEEKAVAAGAITGGIAGALVGGPVGAIIGAGIGGVAGGALTSPAAVQAEQPSSLVRERVLVRRPVPTRSPKPLVAWSRLPALKMRVEIGLVEPEECTRVSG